MLNRKGFHKVLIHEPQTHSIAPPKSTRVVILAGSAGGRECRNAKGVFNYKCSVGDRVFR